MMKNFISQNKKFLAIFAAVFVIGVFLRLYHFEEFLVFGYDQARDAMIARNVLERGEDWPLLGARAVGTQFKLGPAYNYLQIFSSKVFGLTPESLAYPDLFFSILSIPLLYLFLRKYFEKNISLALMGLWSISFFAVKFSRFAWNPNSMPFFTLLSLYALLELRSGGSRKKCWLVVLGLAMGIGVQLHTLFLFIIPPLVIIFLMTRLQKKTISWKNVLAVIAIAIILNFPLVISEYKTRGGNIRELAHGISTRMEKSSGLTYDLFTDLSCHVQANSIVVSSFGNYATCSFSGLYDNPESAGAVSRPSIALRILASIIFSVIGYLSLIYFFRRENDEERKNFLRLTALFIIISFLSFFPLAGMITDRYYLVFTFVPIVLLGLTYQYLRTKTRRAHIIGLLILALLVIQNAITLRNYFTPFKRMALVHDTLLSENRFLADFILDNSESDQKIYIDQKMIDKRIFNYFLESKREMIHVSKKTGWIDPATPYFFITGPVSPSSFDHVILDIPDHRLTRQESFGRFTIAKFEK